jgi:hypothetical protein
MLIAQLFLGFVLVADPPDDLPPPQGLYLEGPAPVTRYGTGFTAELEEEGDQEPAAQEGQISDLTPLNLFSAGWGEPWFKRPRRGLAPDMALLRVQLNFMERTFRLDDAYQHHVQDGKNKSINFAQAFMPYAFDRRIAVEVSANYQWNERVAGPDLNGGGGAIGARLQLVDTEGSSLLFGVRAQAPNRGLNETRTTLGFSLAGFNDLTEPLGLDRMGLYYHVQYDRFSGPTPSGTKTDDFTYALSIAKTWTDLDACPFGNFTTFLEGYGFTNLDGTQHGKSVLSLTPGFRFCLGKGHNFMAGVDLPVSNPHPWSEVFRITYMINF